MKSTPYFPKVQVTHTAAGTDATIAIAFKSILKGNLIKPQGELPGDKSAMDQGPDPRVLQISRESFLHALAGWPERVSLEIRITAAPDLIRKTQGAIRIVVLLHACAPTEEEAKEEVIGRYLALMPLLISHFPEIEFVPVVADGACATQDCFLQATHAVCVHRRVQRINLSEPFRKKVVGLQMTPASEEDCRFTIQHRYPWAPSLNDWSHLMDVLMNQLDPVELIVRARRANLSAGQRADLESNLQNCELFLSGGEPYQVALKRQVEMVRDVTLEHLSTLTSACFHMGVFLMARHPLDISLGRVVGQAVTGNSLLKEPCLFKGDFAVSEVDAAGALDGSFFYEKEAYSVSEAASAFRFPSPPTADFAGLPVRHYRTGLALISRNHNKKKHEIALCSNEHQHVAQPIIVGADDRMRHTFIIGQTGTGKSTLMESMILQDMRGGQGLAVIDPHGDLIDGVLGKIPSERMDDIILFDVLDREHPLGFNILEWSTLDERDLIIDELYTVIDHLYDMRLTGGPMFETNFRGMLKLLMGDKKHDDFTPTILNFITCYLSDKFRDWLGKRIDDPCNQDFIRELERTGGDASIQNMAPYVTSKLGRFMNDTTLMRIIGQETTSFNFEDIMNNGKIFLVKLGKGRFGSQVSALLANMLVSRFKYAAMKRGDLPKDKRKDFYLYVDEAHNLPSENFAELLAEARKFRMSLTLATQYTAQMTSRDKRNSLLSAIIGNVGTIVAFRTGQEDAHIMAPVFQACFSALDMIGLPNWRGYARLQQGGDAVPPFSFRSYRDKAVFNERLAERVKQFSRFMYGTDKGTVDQRIMEQRNAWRINIRDDEEQE